MPAAAVDGSGIITTVAGGGTSGLGDGGPAMAAMVGAPPEVAVDSAGNLYIADMGHHRVRRVDAVTKVISTVAGNGAQGFSGDGGPATEAALNTPVGVAVDGSGNLFIADQYNQRVRRVDAVTRVITTFVGTGAGSCSGGGAGDGGLARDADLCYPRTPAVDSSGNLYIADLYNNRIRRVDVGFGTITTVVGNGTFGFSGDGGPAEQVSLGYPALRI